MIALLLDATLWFKVAILVAVGAVSMRWRRRAPPRVAVLSRLTLAYGIVIGTFIVPA